MAEAAGGAPPAAHPTLPIVQAPAAPVWRTSTVGALVAIALGVAVTLAATVWLSFLDQRRQAQEQLTRQVHHAALLVRQKMAETEQLLLFEGSTYATSPAIFRREMVDLLVSNPALMRVELRDADGAILAAVDAEPPRPSLPAALRRELAPEAQAAAQTAVRQNRLAYSRPYFLQLGGNGFELMELVVPTGASGSALIVATYAPQRILAHFVPPGPPPHYLYSLIEPDGSVVARQAALALRPGGLSAVSPLARTGVPLQLRADTMEGPVRLEPNLLTGLVAATSIGLGLAIAFLVRDISRRERAEQALREQVRFRRAVEDAVMHALIVYDLDDRIVHVNDATCRVSGYSADELVGIGAPLPFTTPESRRDFRAYLDRIAACGGDTAARETVRKHGFETRYRRKDGELVDILACQAPIHDDRGALVGTMLIGVDVSEQKRIAELARRQQEALQSRSRLATLGEMASTLSHELNQPLAAITSYAAACENLVAAASPRPDPVRPDPVRQALRGIRAQAERAGQVVRSVQSFLRRRAIDRTDVDLAALVAGLEPLLKLQAARTGARVELSIPPGTVVHADRVMLEQVLLNLTRNGFEAMADVPAHDRVLELTAAPVADPERGGRIEVTVVDRGRGVPPEVLPQLFTAFFTTKREGMGLGLSLCRSVIEQHGGHLQYRPRAQGGAVFAFDLPTRAEAAPPVPASPLHGVPT